MKIVDFGNKIVYFDENGEIHRDGGPAIIWKDGTWQEWYRHGKLHRDGGKPAVIGPGNTKMYYVNGKII